MRFSPTLFLCALSGTAAALHHTSFKRDLKLSAQLGIHPDELIRSKTSMHAIADIESNSSIKAEYVSVGDRFPCWFLGLEGGLSYLATLC